MWSPCACAYRMCELFCADRCFRLCLRRKCKPALSVNQATFPNCQILSQSNHYSRRTSGNLSRPLIWTDLDLTTGANWITRRDMKINFIQQWNKIKIGIGHRPTSALNKVLEIAIVTRGQKENLWDHGTDTSAARTVQLNSFDYDRNNSRSVEIYKARALFISHGWVDISLRCSRCSLPAS